MRGESEELKCFDNEHTTYKIHHTTNIEIMEGCKRTGCAGGGGANARTLRSIGCGLGGVPLGFVGLPHDGNCRRNNGANDGSGEFAEEKARNMD